MDHEPVSGLEWLAAVLVVGVFVVALANASSFVSGTPFLAAAGATTPTNNTNNNWCGTPTSQASSGSVDEQCKPGCEYQVNLASGGTPQVIVIKSPPPNMTSQQQAALPPGQVTYITGGGQSVQTCTATGKDAAGNPTYSSFGSLNGNAGVSYTENGITAIGNGLSSLFGGSSAPSVPTLPTGGSYFEGYQAGQLAAQANVGPNYPYGSIPSQYYVPSNGVVDTLPGNTLTSQYGGAYQYVPSPTTEAGAGTFFTTQTPANLFTVSSPPPTLAGSGDLAAGATNVEGTSYVNIPASEAPTVGNSLTYGGQQTFTTPPPSPPVLTNPTTMSAGDYYDQLNAEICANDATHCVLLPSTPIPNSYIKNGVPTPPFELITPASPGSI